MNINLVLEELAKEIGTAIVNKIVAQEQARSLQEAMDGNRDTDAKRD